MGLARVAITGIGVISAFGAGREVFWDGIRHGRSGTRAITEFDASSYPCRVAAPVPPVDIADAVAIDGELGPRDTRADPKRYSRAALFGVLAARRVRMISLNGTRRGLATPRTRCGGGCLTVATTQSAMSSTYTGYW